MDRAAFEGIDCLILRGPIRNIVDKTSYTQAPIKIKEVRIWQG